MHTVMRMNAYFKWNKVSILCMQLFESQKLRLQTAPNAWFQTLFLLLALHDAMETRQKPHLIAS